MKKKNKALRRHNPAYRAAPALSSTLAVSADARRGGGFKRTRADSGGLHVHDDSTTAGGGRKPNGRAVLETRLSVIGAVALRDGERLTLRLADGQWIRLSTSTAALVVSVLLADGQVQQEWLHGGGR